MAEGDLYKLLKRVNNALAKDMDSKGEGSARYRAKLGRLPHDLILRRDDIRDEILIQIRDFMLTDELKAVGQKRQDSSGKMVEIKQAVRTTMGVSSGRSREASRDTVTSLAHTAGMTPKQIKAIDTEADRFMTIAKSAAKSPPPSLTAKIMKDAGGELIIRFTPKRANTDVYARINDAIFKKAKDTLTRNLSAVGFPIDKKRGEIFFNIGHITSVSELKAAQALNTVSRGLDKNGATAADMLRTELSAQFTKFGQPEFQKRFLFKTASVTVESQATNLTDSDYEKALLMDVRDALRNALDKMPIAWASEKSSPSLLDAALDGILHETFRSAKHLKVTGLANKADLKSSSAVIADFKSSVKEPKGKVLTGRDFPMQFPVKGAPSYQSLAALLPLINARLPEVIRSHMGTAGRLKNRTGRFSDSAEVIQFSEMFGMTYTYQRDPYGVFEAHSERDPRPLIEMSIREIAIGLTRERFGLRRV